MKLIQAMAFLAAFTFVGCAHSLMRGSVAMKVNDEEAHVCMGDNEVQAGDKVMLYKNVCIAPKGKAGDSGVSGGCSKVRLGEGVVERTFNEHYSLVKVNPGVQFEEGAIVEKR